MASLFPEGRLSVDAATGLPMAVEISTSDAAICDMELGNLATFGGAREQVRVDLMRLKLVLRFECMYRDGFILLPSSMM